MKIQHRTCVLTEYTSSAVASGQGSRALCTDSVRCTPSPLRLLCLLLRHAPAKPRESKGVHAHRHSHIAATPSGCIAVLTISHCLKTRRLEPFAGPSGGSLPVRAKAVSAAAAAAAPAKMYVPPPTKPQGGPEEPGAAAAMAASCADGASSGTLEVNGPEVVTISTSSFEVGIHAPSEAKRIESKYLRFFVLSSCQVLTHNFTLSIHAGTYDQN